ncbi:protein pangolin, isoforms A/H/I/S isoform X2 [Metopolophium dirhodum]|uniref:protein pangolin, isoforms A/H/I/S isoform X2 n=1 Tax=Metopolophium dirhodum TaxID=44670 RepID=UPI00298F9292|nr:protein pangolin, isoforms A/H/I/S isoform X2 [Metopolophium dirhodum]
MPHASEDGGAAGEDACSSDELIVFKDENGGEDVVKRSSDKVTEEKSDLIDLSESEKVSSNHRCSPVKTSSSTPDLNRSKPGPTPHPPAFNMGYLVAPYPSPYTNGTTSVSMMSSYLESQRDPLTASKIGLGPAHPFFCHNGEQLGTQPPPAHMGIPPYQLDKAPGLPRPSMYPFPTGQYPYPLLSPDMSQVAASWHTPASMYHQISSAGTGFRGSYPPSLGTSLTSELYRFSPTGLMGGPSPHHHLSHHTHHSHPAIVTPGVRQDLHTDSNHRPQNDHSKNSSCSDGSKHHDTVQNSNNQDKKKPHIKKPLNAFMLYMKEMRAKVVAECTLKESAAINQILGRRWHALGREEQAKYYELARRERQIHMQLYPDWSSRTNATRAKKRKRKQETHDGGNNSMKKCRARYGLDQQSQWCKPCRRKKRCIRYIESGGDSGNQSDDNQSTGSLGHSDNEEADSASSPGGLSALSSLTSPGMLTQASLSPATPLTPHVSEYDCPPMSVRMPLAVVVPTRHHQPVGTNPHDINNPLSVNQLTGGVVNNKCHNNPRDQQQQQQQQHQQQNDLKTGGGPNNQPEQQQRPNNSNRALPAISVT